MCRLSFYSQTVVRFNYVDYHFILKLLLALIMFPLLARFALNIKLSWRDSELLTARSNQVISVVVNITKRVILVRVTVTQRTILSESAQNSSADARM